MYIKRKITSKFKECQRMIIKVGQQQNFYVGRKPWDQEQQAGKVC